MSRFLSRIAVLLTVVMSCVTVAQAELRALAIVDASQSAISNVGNRTEIRLSLSQPVPWRAFTSKASDQLIIELQQARLEGEVLGAPTGTHALTLSRAEPGWTRLTMDLSGPSQIETAELQTGKGTASATLAVDLVYPASGNGLAQNAQHQGNGLAPELARTGRPVIVLDPGHGGIDPGAVVGGLVEADLMLTFARELRGVLRATQAFEIVLTRDADTFVPLEARITRARQAGADVFLSLHADALPPDAGRASGATIYTLAAEASDRASELLAERHDQNDLITGVDLTGQGDEIALVLMDLARSVTAPRSAALADHMVTAIANRTGATHSNPRRHAAFSVLKAPDFPSVLIEVGFLSSEKDRKRLADPAERLKLAQAIADGLLSWSAKDRQRAARLK